MKIIQINGINGFLELNKKYVYFFENDYDKKIEYIIWFDEIENVIYKKPTKNKYGFISITTISKKKKNYKLILDKIDEKSLDTNKKIYNIIKNIIENKNIRVKEVVDNKIEEKEEVEETKEEDTIVIEDYNVIDKEDDYKEDIKTISSKIDVIANEIHNEEQELDDNKDIEVIEENNEQNGKDFSLIDVDYNSIEEELSEDEIYEEDEYDQEEVTDYKNEKDENKEKDLNQQKYIDSLIDKIEELEKQLKIIAYKEIIIDNYVDDSMDRKKTDKLIIELKNIIEKIELIKKEIIKQEKILNKNEFIKLHNGNVIITSINKLLLDSNKTDIYDYLGNYKKINNEIDRVELETESLKKKTDNKLEQLKLSDDDYDKEINRFKNVKSNKDFISNYIKEIKEDLSKVKWKIEKEINPQVKYKFIKKSISSQTKRLAALTTLNGLRPRRSRFSMIALSFFTGTSALNDLLGYDIKKVEYNEIIQKEILEGLESIDTEKARYLINDSKDQIDKILYECEKKYSEYPNFNKLKKDLIKLKSEIEKQDKELTEIEEKVSDYNLGPKVKVLRIKQE